MDSTSAQLQVRTKMGVFSADGKRVGTVWNVFSSNTETYVVVVPFTVWQWIIDAVTPRRADPERGYLYLPANLIKQVSGKQVILDVAKEEARRCTSRPAWLPRESEINPLQL